MTNYAIIQSLLITNLIAILSKLILTLINANKRL